MAAAGSKGDLVHDSHAEVVAKRAFQLYLIDQIRWAGNLNLDTRYRILERRFYLECVELYVPKVWFCIRFAHNLG